MFAFASHQIDHSGGHEQGQDAQRSHPIVGRFGPAPICDQQDTYYWTDEGYEYLRGSIDGVEHYVPLIVLPRNRATNDKLAEAVAERSVLYAIITAFIISATIVLAGSVGLPRAEHAAVVAARV